MAAPPEIGFLTQDEVAKILRRSVKSIARLREAGELAWLPGSPILIPRTEVAAYLDRKMVKRNASTAVNQPTPEDKGEALIARLKRQGKWDGIVAFGKKTRDAQKRDKL